MASVKYGTIVTDIKGKVGGNIFQGGYRGPAMKKLWGYIRKGKRLYKLWGYIKRSAMSEASQGWRELTTAQRTQWDAAAPNFPAYDRFGDAYTPSGYQLWCTVQIRQIITGRAIDEVAPSPVVFPVIDNGLTILINPELVRITLLADLPAGWILQLEATAGISAGANTARGGYCLIGYYDPTIGGIVDATTNYVLQMGAPIEGSTVLFRMRPVSPGGLVNNVWVYKSSVVVAV